MHVIKATSPDEALLLGIAYLKQYGITAQSRAGDVLVAPTPVMTVHMHPRSRISTAPLRDANPFFHLAETVWMLDGRNDLASLTKFVKRFADFSDDGSTLHGAYGYRWRIHFEPDQLRRVIDLLRGDPTTRRAVLAMWDPNVDCLGPASKARDIPCNTHVYFSTVRGVLDMTVCCRSNDIVWGAYGANVVHFSFLQEYVAGAAGLAMGKFYQLSNNYHAYIGRPDVERLFSATGAWYGPPMAGGDISKDVPPIVSHGVTPDAAEDEIRRLAQILDDPLGEPTRGESVFAREVFGPMMFAHALRRRSLKAAIESLMDYNNAWTAAGIAWLRRRADSRAAEAVRPA